MARAVVTVPAYFDGPQVEATRRLLAKDAQEDMRTSRNRNVAPNNSE